MSEAKILFSHDQHIATITLNRPEKLNALDPAMLKELEKAAETIEQLSDIRVVLLCAAGAKAFCVGADINAWSALDPLDMWRQWVRDGHRVFGRIANLPQPVIALINGYTFGGGLELALAADIRLSVDTAEFAMPEVKIATAPGWAGSQRLPALIGASRAKQMIFTGSRIPASKAEQWGLVNELVPAEALENAGKKMAEEIAANAPISVQITKQLVNAASGQTSSAMALEALAGALAASTSDGKEGIRSFQEKRPPKYSGE